MSEVGECNEGDEGNEDKRDDTSLSAGQAVDLISDVDKLRMLAKFAVNEPVRLTEQGRDVMIALADEVERLRQREDEAMLAAKERALASGRKGGSVGSSGFTDDVDDLVALLSGGVGENVVDKKTTSASKTAKPSLPAGQQSKVESSLADSELDPKRAVPQSDPFGDHPRLADSSKPLEITPEWLVARLMAKQVPSPSPHNPADHFVRDYHRATEMVTLVLAPTGHLWLVALEIEYKGDKKSGVVNIPPARWQIGPVKYTRDIERVLVALQLEPAKPKFVLPVDGGVAERVSEFVEEVALAGW
jgi:hypothetical protein